MATSPLPQPTEESLSFPKAMEAVIKGYSVTKQEWGNSEHCAMLRKGFLMIMLEDGWHTWLISEGDMHGTDWVIA